MKIIKTSKFCKNNDKTVRHIVYCCQVRPRPLEFRAVKMAASRSKRTQKRSFSPSAPHTNIAKKKKVTLVGKMPNVVNFQTKSVTKAASYYRGKYQEIGQWFYNFYHRIGTLQKVDFLVLPMILT
jgi:hypothetical protein